MMTRKQLVLASTSPFRQRMLSDAGFTFHSMKAPLDEHTVRASMPREQAQKRAEAKAQAAAEQRRKEANGEELVIGADQVLAHDGESFDKVTTQEEARARLERLAGKTHTLHSGYAIFETGRGGTRSVVSRVVDVSLTMRSLTPEELDAYVATGEWQGSVGCYRYEARGILLFSHVEGEASAIVGLPLLALSADLRDAGINPLAP